MPPSYQTLFGNGPTSSRTAPQPVESEVALRSSEASAFKPVSSKIPGRAVAANQRSSDYSKALHYAEFSTNGESSSGKNLPRAVSGTGDPSDLNLDPEKSGEVGGSTSTNIVTSEPRKLSKSGDPAVSSSRKTCSNGNGDRTVGTSVNFCAPNSICQTYDDVPNFPPPAYDETPDPPSDPDSGEGMDKLKPLCSDSGTQANGVPHHPSHPQTSSGSSASESGGNQRERTVSTSSIASDGWGATVELLQKHDYFKVISRSTMTSVPASESNDSQATRSEYRTAFSAFYIAIVISDYWLCSFGDL